MKSRKFSLHIHLINLFILTISFFSCNQYSQKEQLVIDFLNKNEESFDKKSFEFVQLELKDTIMEHEIYKINSINIINSDILYDIESVVDSTVSSDYVDSEFKHEINWSEEDYPIKLYGTLTSSYDYTSYNLYEEMQLFFKKSKIFTPKDFERELMNNHIFLDSLQSKMSYYSQPFTGCFDSDSLKKYVDISKSKRETFVGYLYILKFRIKDKLKIRSLLMNKSNQIIGFKIIGN
jgi:hypothetical protein